MHRWIGLVLPALIASAWGQSPAQRRQEVLARPDDAEALIQALGDENLVVRRTAIRLLLQHGPPSFETLDTALGNSDVVVRSAALWSACRSEDVRKLDLLARAASDPEGLIRRMAIEEAIAMQARPPRIKALLEAAQKDKDETVRRIAVRALWPFRGQSLSLREREDYDRDVTVTDTLPVPRDGWKFRLDPQREGHLAEWFTPDVDDSGWDSISIEQAWQKAGYQHTGVAWYRRTVTFPTEPEHTAVDLHFHGVDESAWVWLNGHYLGKHDIGPEGWDKPFLLDCTKEARWGQSNLLVVRAMNTRFAGGIWRPVEIEILK